MSFMSAMEIISSGLSASRLRMNLIASNLANANTTRTDAGGPYQRRDPVFRSTPLQLSFADILRDRMATSLRGVTVTQVVNDPRPPRTVYDPGHPDADKQGIVKLPNVNAVEEMVDMITASRAYEAGVTAMQSIKAMANKALSIGR
jgi:flagellar basal-body rod protein FlgC